MILPGSYAVLAPLFVGFLIGPACLAGMLGGAITSVFVLAVMMSNAGGAWDNSKKYIENENTYGGKKSETHKACVVGDTVGDPFKDTSGPALNILIKLMSMVSLTMAPLVENNDDWENWMYGMAPTAIFVVASLILSPLVMDIVGWSDPLKDLIQGSQSSDEKRDSAKSLSTDATKESQLKPQAVVPAPQETAEA